MTGDQEYLRGIVRGILGAPTGSDDHKLQRRTRWIKAARAAVEAGPGDIVEIGAMEGDSTVEFCKIAEEHGRRVLVVDPWTPGTQNCQGHEHEMFMHRTERWRESDILRIARHTSQYIPVIEALIDRNWAFALVDGLHKYGEVLGDIMAVRRARIICVDDLNMSEVDRAFGQATALLPSRTPLSNETYPERQAKKWEGYIV